MKKEKLLKIIIASLAVVILGAGISIPVLAGAADNTRSEAAQAAEDDAAAELSETEAAEAELAQTAESSETAAEITDTADNTKSTKALAAAVVVGIAAAAGALGMALAISKAVEGTARQPEAGGKIQTMLMLGLVFIETAIIYALIVAILIIFVL